MSYRITTDSTCDMPDAFYEERGIAHVNLSLEFNGKEYKDGFNENLSAHTFYESLRNGGMPPPPR